MGLIMSVIENPAAAIGGALSEIAVPVDALSQVGPGIFPGVRRPFRSLWWLVKTVTGTACVVLVLAIMAAIPGLHILTLGFLINAQKRVAVSGRIRDGFPLLKIAPRLGILVVFTLLFCIPLRIQASRLSDALVLLGPQHQQTQRLQTMLLLLQWLVALHLLAAILNGCTVSCFLRPLRNLRRLLAWRHHEKRQQVTQVLQALLALLSPWQHFVTGLRGFLGAALWLVLPTSLLMSYAAPDRTRPVFGLLSFLGGVLLILVFAWLPWLQVQQAVQGRFMAIFSVRTVRQAIRSAPLAWMLSTVLLYVLTFPLYLGKIRLPPQDALLILTPVFVLLTYPARLVTAWAWHRAAGRAQPASRWLHIPVRLLMIPLLGLYSFFLLLTPSISELGRNAPFENQAFLGPVPYAQWRQPQQVREELPASHSQQDDDDQSQPDRNRDQQQPEQSGPAVEQTVGQP